MEEMTFMKDQDGQEHLCCPNCGHTEFIGNKDADNQITLSCQKCKVKFDVKEKVIN